MSGVEIAGLRDEWTRETKTDDILGESLLLRAAEGKEASAT